MNDDSIDDKFRPVQAADVTDLALLPRRFDALASEVRLGFEMFGNKILPALDRIRDAIEDLAVRVTRLEKDWLAADKRLTAIEQEIGASRRKQAKRKK